MLVPTKIRESHVKNRESYTGFLSLRIVRKMYDSRREKELCPILGL